MLSKPATMLLGLIDKEPLNAYELIKRLNYMNVKWWFYIADSTVYSTLKTLEKKDYIAGTTEKSGNMPDRTVYRLTGKGKDAFIDTLRTSVLQFDYDTNIFSVAAFFLDTFPPDEQQELLQKRLEILQKYRAGIEKHGFPVHAGIKYTALHRLTKTYVEEKNEVVKENRCCDHIPAAFAHTGSDFV